MESENIKVIRQIHAALNRRDIDAIVARWDEEAEFRPIMSSLEGEVYRGHEGLRRWTADLFQDWEVFEVYGDEYRDLGDRVLAFGRWHARGRSSGIELDVTTAAWLARLRNGKVTWYQTFTDRGEALSAAGLDE
jgi:ketosteroid isomerase-like protein